MSQTTPQIWAWMRKNANKHRDPVTREINLTHLVEDWDSWFGDSKLTLDPDHPAWEIASQVKDELEASA